MNTSHMPAAMQRVLQGFGNEQSGNEWRYIGHHEEQGYHIEAVGYEPEDKNWCSPVMEKHLRTYDTESDHWPSLERRPQMELPCKPCGVEIYQESQSSGWCLVPK